ncbi:MAG: hypothetical protein ACI8UO_000221 [Verrucomicrobiales bacterium]|jgi:hypothetical protein
MHFLSKRLLPVFLCLGGISAFAAPLDYNFDVQPILSENCFFCHGPDAANRKGDLRLDVREAAIEAGVIVPGKPDESELIKRILTSDPDDLMPPPDSHRRLTSLQKETLRQWIAEGAEYKGHWAFISLKTAEIPHGDEPNPIDRFVREGLTEKQLEMQPRAEAIRLARRVSFDLTGLPPTAAQIAMDYEKLVEQLLASETFGERMATPWLDLARYADTYGFQVDRDRNVWPWRDWVIKAFNENLPFDQFLTWQLAGDLLPNATDEQLLATTFCRLHQQKVEGGSTEEEFRVEYVADRIQTIATATMGLTWECARCHDHKYDPITQKNYYEMFAFFDDIDEAGLYSYFTPSVPTPTMMLTSDAQKTQIADLRAAVAAEETKLAKITSEAEPKPLADELGHFDFEKVEGGKIADLVGEKPASTSAANTLVEGKSGQAIQLTGDDAVKLEFGNFTRHEPFSIALWMWTPDVKERAVIFHRSRAWTDAGSRGYELLLEDGKPSWALIHFWPGNAIRIQTKAALPLKTWTHVAVSSDGSSRADGLRIFVDGKPADFELVMDNLTKNITGGGGDNITIGERFRDRGFKGGRVDEFRVFNRELTEFEVAKLAGVDAQPSEPDALAADEAYRQQLLALSTARKKLGDVLDKAQEIMVMRESPKPKQAFLLERGAYDAHGEKVDPGTPAALPPFPDDLPRNRLGYAKWLTDPAHPLTARVAVNHFWKSCFGTGLVATPEDFGSQGARPEYPKLLDWLSNEFIESGWDVKHIMKLIVTSQTYQQRSFADSKLMADDPKNRFLARGPRHRLSAEMIRDNALAASGLLVQKIGGAPVRPYELAESFKPSKPGSGEALHRRSVYTYWKRTGPAPAMMAFDAVKRDVCSAQRETTSTPLQALVLLNGPQFVEAARMLGENSWKAAEGDPDKAIKSTFAALTSREANDRELAILRSMFDEQLAHFREQEAEAKEFLGVGETKRDESIPVPEAAAIGVVAKALMSYDESVMKR